MKIIILLACLFISSVAFSQKDGPPPGGPREELLRVKMQKFMEALQVDSVTAIKYFEKAFENRKALNQLNRKRQKLMDEIESNLDAADLSSKLDRVQEIELEITNQRKSFLTELETFLTSKQIAQAILLEKRFSKKLKEEIQKRKRDKYDGNPEE